MGAAATANASTTPYAVTASNANGTGLSNYNITYADGGLTVNKANLTITANDTSKAYGTTLNFLGNEFTTNGLLNSDQITSADIASAGSANTAMNGTYGIDISNASGSGLSNYNIAYQSGMMTVGMPDAGIPQTVVITSQQPSSFDSGNVSAVLTENTATKLIHKQIAGVEIDPKLLNEINYNPFFQKAAIDE
jgi:hypothetical protein